MTRGCFKAELKDGEHAKKSLTIIQRDVYRYTCSEY